MASAGLDDSRFIISGGPVPQNVTEGHGSLGAYVRNRMRLNGNDVGLVSLYDCAKCEVSASQLFAEGDLRLTQQAAG